MRTSVRGSVQKSRNKQSAGAGAQALPATSIRWAVAGLLFGANANNGVNAGVRNSNANNVPTNTNTNISAQLSAQFLKATAALPTGQKIKPATQLW